MTQVADWTTKTEQLWLKVAPSLRGIRKGEQVPFGHQQLILTLAVTKFLSRQANVLVQRVVPRDLWADIVVQDVVEQIGAHCLRFRSGCAKFVVLPDSITVHYTCKKASSKPL